MLKHIFKALHHESKGLHGAAYLLALFSLFSQALALVRDRIFAHTFGADAALDLYYAAFKIPDVIFISFASLVSLAALIPFLTEHLHGGVQHSTDAERESARVRELLDSVFTVFFIAITLASLIAFILMPILSRALFAGFSAEGLEELTALARIMLLQPIFLGVSNLYACITQLRRKFLLYSVSPLLYNIGIIIGAVLLYPALGIRGLACGVVFGAAMHFLVQMPFVVSSGLMPRFSRRIKFSFVRAVSLVSLPRTFALSANQFALLALLALASREREGTVSIFTFAYNLQSVPLALIGVSYSVAAFPALSRFAWRGEHHGFLDETAETLRHIIFWALPAFALVVVFRVHIVRAVLGTGAFSASDTQLTAASLALFTFSLPAQSAALLLVRAFYAAGKTRPSVIAAAVSAAVTIAAAYALTPLFTAHPPAQRALETFLFGIEGVPDFSAAALPLAFSLGAWMNAGVLFAWFRHAFAFSAGRLRRSFFESLAASFALATASYSALLALERVFNPSTFFGVILQVLCAGLAGTAVAVLTLHLFGSRELQRIARSIGKRSIV